MCKITNEVTDEQINLIDTKFEITEVGKFKRKKRAEAL